MIHKYFFWDAKFLIMLEGKGEFLETIEISKGI
jgi:hypothetical protein